MLGYTYYIVTKKLTHIYAQNILSNIFQAEEEGAMEEDEVEEMDVVEEEMVGGEDEEVQLVDEVAVDEEAVVQMRQTFHQVSLVILYWKEESEGNTVPYQLLKYQSKTLYKYVDSSFQISTNLAVVLTDVLCIFTFRLFFRSWTIT